MFILFILSFNSFRNKILLLVLHLLVLIAAVTCCKRREPAPAPVVVPEPCTKSKSQPSPRRTKVSSKTSVPPSSQKPRRKLPEPFQRPPGKTCGGPDCPPCPPKIYQCPPNHKCKRCKSCISRPSKNGQQERFIEPFLSYNDQRPPPPCPT